LSAKRVARIMDIVQKQHIRTAILAALRTVYPRSLSVAKLQSALEQARGLDIAQNPLRVELHYLHDKDLLCLKASGKNANARVTARGIDYLDGHIQEVGLASPDLYQ